jgi:hypothetical protein
VRLNVFGHSHSDAYKVAMSYSDPVKAVGVLTICGSITSWTGKNPSFCVYEVDLETMLPIRRQAIAFDLDKANEQRVIEWVNYTDWTVDYALTDLSPASY